MSRQPYRQIIISILLGIFYGVCLYALVNAGGRADSVIWKLYDGIVWGVAGIIWGFLIGLSNAIMMSNWRQAPSVTQALLT